ncbi:MBL fold metallo-hydrolase [Legionella taurinensis]|uniref:MBL fold metallo-hydrolase n=1 Tax=Legionella taurinensis TaxID=70611 RepID=A0A3A5L2A7_9GAMM|nr:MBL fold metallo-hydrolase [Legionella taurinensis]MDX1838547.1 MBL fold metallo-hydrolase [Legionella taurinensis]PUT38993.1 MBL fold metallo-hydrolase [Legionella taurinensis]PUT41080.1 MBL fold metallo-hydrolase [Legionella taurinensis]PUT43455.1 MBL fold metallo-hydrolase [Legionella taurinensis]PUT46472.1 MBL fold metallo-hydrolase [Legionella taurinensis]
MKIQFLGAVQTVTGSKYLIQTNQINLLVDCGLFQGYKELRLRNWATLPINPQKIDYVLLTHAHIDHSGYIPLLIKNGFRGKILCTAATKDLCSILLPDSGHLQEEDARYANRKGYSKHHPALPLYTQQEAEDALNYFQVISFEERISIADNLQATFYYGGHILGASFIRLEQGHTSILFSGDLGRQVDPLMFAPKEPLSSDFLVIESTYGNRIHDKTDPLIQLKEIINRTVKRGGSIIIPSFAVGRTQSLLYYLYELKSKNEIPDIPVFVDSPMATHATKIFSRYAEQNRLTREQNNAVCAMAHYINSVDESIALDHQQFPSVVISASGMATGGRILHHIRHFAPDPKNTILFSGFQVGGTRGDRMIRGEREIKMFGQMIPVRAEVVQMDNISAHADSIEMLNWLARLKKAPRKLFITHGEKEASQALKSQIEQRFNWVCEIPSYLDSASLCEET